jgi:hypothetical protein
MIIITFAISLDYSAAELRVFAPGFVNYKKGAFDSQPQVIKLIGCMPMVGGSLRLLPPLKLVAMI